MKIIRRILGIWVMFAGILGLVLSLAGLAAVWVYKPTVTGYVDSTVATLDTSISTSLKVMQTTGEALGATVESVNALSTMLDTTAILVDDTKPVLVQINSIMGDTLPSSLESAVDSLKTAQQAAVVLDSTIKSLENFRSLISAVPLLSTLVEQPTQTYDPEKPLADSLGELASNLESLPEAFTVMSTNLDQADGNLTIVQNNLISMSGSVELISKSLSEYEAMVVQSQSSTENLRAILGNIQSNQTSILNGVVIVLSLFLLWLLTIQVVVLSQGWELFQGTAGHMEGRTAESTTAEPTAEEENQ